MDSIASPFCKIFSAELSLKANPLHRKDLFPTVIAMTAADRTRRRLKEELDARGISQRDLADILSRRDTEIWTQSKLGKILNGRVELKVEDVDLIARAAGINLTEAVRDRGMEFCAEMTPSELRVLERLRQRPDFLEGVMMLLDIPSTTAKPNPTTSPRRKRGRPLNSELAR